MHAPPLQTSGGVVAVCRGCPARAPSGKTDCMPTRRDFLRTAALAPWATQLMRAQKGKPPNFVLIFLDDSGWADFHPFGNPAYKTPNVQRLATQGCRSNNFYVPQAV